MGGIGPAHVTVDQTAGMQAETKTWASMPEMWPRAEADYIYGYVRRATVVVPTASC